MGPTKPGMGRVLTFVVSAPRWKLFLVAVLSRVVLCAWTVFCGWLLPDYDESARLNDVDLRLPEVVHGTRPAPALEMLWHWDAVHFRHIADYGYTHESNFAFFPLVPLMVRSLEHLTPSAPFMVFTLFQFGFFAASVIAMRRALFAIIDDKLDIFAATAAVPAEITSSFDRERRTKAVVGAATLFYILSPAAVFTVVSYTEPFYCALTLGGFVLLRRRWALMGSVWFALATAARSNGILSALFLFLDSTRILIQGRKAGGLTVLQMIYDIAARLLGACLVVVPYLVVNRSAFTSFCRAIPNASPGAVEMLVEGVFHRLEWVSPASVKPAAAAVARAVDDMFASTSESRVDPTVWACPGSWLGMYTDIQRRHWGLGFLAYYEWRNIHNFFIALPLYLAMGIGLVYGWRCSGWRLGSVRRWALGFLLGSPHTIWLYAMLFIAITRMHVQVTTRFVFMSPAFYLLLGARAATSPLYWRGLLFYIAVYVILSPVLFANFYPWT
jgi:Gpi18-like mannosyltransferase